MSTMIWPLSPLETLVVGYAAGVLTVLLVQALVHWFIHR